MTGGVGALCGECTLLNKPTGLREMCSEIVTAIIICIEFDSHREVLGGEQRRREEKEKGERKWKQSEITEAQRTQVCAHIW